MKYTDAEIWDACVTAMRDGRPLEVHRVAKAAELPESDIVAALIRETLPRRKSVEFRFPPLPCAAITRIS